MLKHNPYSLVISRHLTSSKLASISEQAKVAAAGLAKAAVSIGTLEEACRNLRIAMTSRAE